MFAGSPADAGDTHFNREKFMKLHIAALGAALGMLLGAPAFAADEQHTLSASPADRCQGALPSFEGSLRKRPLAVQNEGTSSAFITCAFAVESRQSLAGSQSLSTWFYNANATDVELTCTAVTGYQTGTNEYVSDSVTIPAGEQDQIFWTDADFAEGIDGLVSISCNLPPGVGVNDTYINWAENDAEAPAP